MAGDGTKEVTGSWETLDKLKPKSKDIFPVGGHEIVLTDIERHIWKDISKAELIKYYISISDYILPYLKDRPLGINISLYNPAESFFIRGMEGRAPDWATIFLTDRKHKKPGKSDKIEWLVCNDIATLVWVVNLGSIDLHPWASRTRSPNNPDYISIDLDPSDDDFSKAVTTALAAKQLFDEVKLTALVKTSGKTGLHIFIPCQGIEYGRARSIAENICSGIHELVPGITTLSTGISSRGNKLYIDPSQNDYADRLAAAYCVRANSMPTVSTPLKWTELKSSLKPEKFTIETILPRVKKVGDLFEDVFNKKIAKQNGEVLSTMFA